METAKIITGVLGAMLILSGVMYTLKPTGNVLKCSSGWAFQSFGKYEGQYACITSTNARYSYCSNVTDSLTGRKNYWCYEALPVKIESEPINVTPQDNLIHPVKIQKCSEAQGCVNIN